MAAESTAQVLVERVDALAAALRAAGVSPEQSSRLLSVAAEATMRAVTLHALLDEQPQSAAAAEPAAPIAEPRRRPVAIAA